MLTKKQHELLSFMHKQIDKTGISPSFDEMKSALNLRSKSGIHRLITALEERGFVRRLPHRARALEILKLPDAATPDGRSKMTAQIIRNEFPPAFDRKPPDINDVISLPLYGRIAAGTPIEALRNPNTHVHVPISLLDRGEHFALDVSGDSMIDAGIFDGDTAVVQRCETAENGAIVVALIDREEATLKRLRRKGNSVALEPANQNYETRIFPPNRVTIQGRLVALVRKYS